jgi:hypothetical protein
MAIVLALSAVIAYPQNWKAATLLIALTSPFLILGYLALRFSKQQKNGDTIVIFAVVVLLFTLCTTMAVLTGTMTQLVSPQLVKAYFTWLWVGWLLIGFISACYALKKKAERLEYYHGR